MFGAAAMSLSSLCVVGNALRLRGFRASEQQRGIRTREYATMRPRRFLGMHL